MTDKMIVAGAKRLAELAPAMKDPDQALLPDFGGELFTYTELICRCRFCKLRNLIGRSGTGYEGRCCALRS